MDKQQSDGEEGTEVVRGREQLREIDVQSKFDLIPAWTSRNSMTQEA